MSLFTCIQNNANQYRSLSSIEPPPLLSSPLLPVIASILQSDQYQHSHCNASYEMKVPVCVCACVCVPAVNPRSLHQLSDCSQYRHITITIT